MVWFQICSFVKAKYVSIKKVLRKNNTDYREMCKKIFDISLTAVKHLSFLTNKVLEQVPHI